MQENTAPNCIMKNKYKTMKSNMLENIAPTKHWLLVYNISVSASYTQYV